jgi:hypothetical protein
MGEVVLENVKLNKAELLKIAQALWTAVKY